jgi:hypothetical protein
MKKGQTLLGLQGDLGVIRLMDSKENFVCKGARDLKFYKHLSLLNQSIERYMEF